MATRPVGTVDRAAVADVHDQDHQPVIVDCVQDPVITGDPDPQNPVHPVSIFAPARQTAPAPTTTAA
jgi:hypothetical protein